MMENSAATTGLAGQAYQWIELHNHTTESDGDILPEDLPGFFARHDCPAFAVTDHNTTAGLSKVREALARQERKLELVEGIEFTTFYGHVLGLGTNRYFSWRDLDPDYPEPFFRQIRAAGARIGIAHPFGIGHPVARGDRFDMKIRDFTCLDFIEVINNSRSLRHINSQAIAWWEELVLSGFRIAATTGLDLHRPRSLDHTFKTYIPVGRNSPCSKG